MACEYSLIESAGEDQHPRCTAPDELESRLLYREHQRNEGPASVTLIGVDGISAIERGRHRRAPTRTFRGLPGSAVRERRRDLQ